MKQLSKLVVSILTITLFLAYAAPSHAQMVWRQAFGDHRVLLYSTSDHYFCTWAINSEPPTYSAFDFVAGRPLSFRVRWRTETTTGVSEGLLLRSIVNGIDYPFMIKTITRGQAMTDIAGEFFALSPQKSMDDLWRALSEARSFRVYLPNGQFKDAEPVNFDIAAKTVLQCLGEASELNKAKQARP